MEHVYFFRENNSEYVKIGKAINYKNRFNSFKTYCAAGAYVVGTIKCLNGHELENCIHKEFKEYRGKGEFFKLTDSEVKDIINKYSQKPNKEVVEKIAELIQVNDITIDELEKLFIIIKRKKNVKKETTTVEYTKEISPYIDFNKTDIYNFKLFVFDKLNKKISSRMAGGILSMLGFTSKVIKVAGKAKRIQVKI